MAVGTPPRDPRDQGADAAERRPAAEAIAQAIAVAKVTDIAADRVSILRGVVAAIDDPRNTLPQRLVRDRRGNGRVRTDREEARIEKQYAALTASTLKRAQRPPAAPMCASVERVHRQPCVRRDAQLGRKRPDEINALLAQVQVQLDAARRLRLARDRWQEARRSYRAYMKASRRFSNVDGAGAAHLDDIKRLADPMPTISSASAIGLRRTRRR